MPDWRQIPRRAVSKASRVARAAWRQRSDRLRGTFRGLPRGGEALQAPGLDCRMTAAPRGLLELHRGRLLSQAERYCRHEFNLLGSGWICIQHGSEWPGFEGRRFDMAPFVDADAQGRWLSALINRSNLAESQRLWRLIEQPYRPIDWQVDAKSGYRWSESDWHGDCSIEYLPGRDVKMPWELGRCQHLPQLALAFQLTDELRWRREFQNQVLDFMACNPPAFGVQWRCPMDVAIRAANWLLAYDLFRAAGAEFDPAFETALADSLFCHGRHIARHLEWHPRIRGNHYLANLAGLLFVACYLPSGVETDAWLSFATGELIHETRRQFLSDGASFEASTCYHRLSAEMVAASAALLLGVDERRLAVWRRPQPRIARRPKPRRVSLRRLPGLDTPTALTEDLFQRLEMMAEFTAAITKPSGRVHQVGDNDSGRFWKLPMTPLAARPRGDSEPADQSAPRDRWDDAAEDALDHRHLLATIGAITGRADLQTLGAGAELDAHVVSCLAGGRQPRVVRRSHEKPTIARVCSPPPTLRTMSQQSCDLLLPESVSLAGAATFAFPAFGLYIWSTAAAYLAVRCGSLSAEDHGGHAHHDQLAVEWHVLGQDVLSDPGSYVYTPSREARNQYRSVEAHFCPQLMSSREPGRFDQGLFALRDAAQASCLYFSGQGFLGRHSGFGPAIYREIEIMSDRVRIRDYSPHQLKARELPREIRVGEFCQPPVQFSPGYGVLAPVHIHHVASAAV